MIMFKKPNNQIKFYQVKRFNSGFTLIETLVAIMMVSIAFLGIYSATARYAQQTKQVKDIYVASLLGQEGIEIARNIRDANWTLGTGNWDDGLTSCSGCSGQTNGCMAQYNDTSLSAYDSTKYLYIDDGNSFYKYIASPSGSDVKTNYRRQICIDSGSDVLHVTVNVFWTGGRQTTIKEDLYNWKW